MPLYLLSRFKPDFAYEVLSYDKAACTAVLRGPNGVFTDTNFHLYIIKRCCELTDVKPACLKG